MSDILKFFILYVRVHKLEWKYILITKNTLSAIIRRNWGNLIDPVPEIRQKNIGAWELKRFWMVVSYMIMILLYFRAL